MDKASAGHVGEAARIQAVLQILPAAKEETRAPYARVRIIILVEGPEKAIPRRFNFDFLVVDVRGSRAVKPRRVRCSLGIQDFSHPED